MPTKSRYKINWFFHSAVNGIFMLQKGREIVCIFSNSSSRVHTQFVWIFSIFSPLSLPMFIDWCRELTFARVNIYFIEIKKQFLMLIPRKFIDISFSLYFSQRDHIILDPAGTDITSCLTKGNSQVSLRKMLPTIEFNIYFIFLLNIFAGLRL